MKKKLFLISIHLMLFWVFVNSMPGLDSPRGPVGLFIGGLFYGVIQAYLAGILKFFKFPVNFWGKAIVGSLLTLLYLALLNYVVTGIITFGPGYIGGSDFLIFSIPKLMILDNGVLVLIVSTVLLNICSIILSYLGKTD